MLMNVSSGIKFRCFCFRGSGGGGGGWLGGWSCGNDGASNGDEKGNRIFGKTYGVFLIRSGPRIS